MDDSKGNHANEKPTDEHLRADAAAGDEEPKQEPVVVAPPPEYPQRPCEPDCSYYLKFGRCGYGTTCMFNHPPIKPSSAIAGGGDGEHQQGQEATTTTEFPQRPGEADCSYYVKFGRCKYGMSCMFNHPPPRQLPGFPATAGVCKCNHHQVEQVKLNSLGLPLRPAAGLCSYYMHKGMCKFGTNCRFHHPADRSESEQEAGSSQHNFFSRLGDIIAADPDLSSPLGPPPLELPTPFLLRPSSKEPPVQVYPCQEQSGGYQQLGDSHFEPAKPVRYRYTRDQLLQLREVIVDCENVPFAALENTILEDRKESSSTAPEISLVVNTTASKQCFCDASNIGKVDKDVHKKCDQEILRKSLTEESSSAESKKNYMHEEFKHLVEFSENVCPSNSMASMQIDQVRCSFSEILELICRCWSCGGHA